MRPIDKLFYPNFLAIPPSSLLSKTWHPSCEWVRDGEGVPLMLFQGIPVLVNEGLFLREYNLQLLPDRIVRLSDEDWEHSYSKEDFEAPPDYWMSGEEFRGDWEWHGWLGFDPRNPANTLEESIVSAMRKFFVQRVPVDLTFIPDSGSIDGLYALAGWDIDDNPYGLEEGDYELLDMVGEFGDSKMPIMVSPPERDWDSINEFFEKYPIYGIVWQHEDGRQARVLRTDFGHPWPDVQETS